MTDRTTISLGAIWEETIAFFRAELGLLTPLALLGFSLPAVVFELIQPEKLIANGQPVSGPWMLWSIPYALLSMMGTLSISALALNPGMSVRESLVTAFARLATGIGVVALAIVGLMVLMLLFLTVAAAGIAPNGELALPAKLAFFFVLAIAIMIAVRFLPIWAVLAARPITPLAAIRQTLLLTRGLYPKLFVLRLIAGLGQMTVLFVVVNLIAMVSDQIGRATDTVAIAQLLTLLLSSAMAAAVLTLWTVYVARLYLRLAGASKGI